MVFTVVVFATFLILPAILLVATRRPAYQARVTRNLPKASGLNLPEWLVPSIIQRNNALIVRMCIGMAAGALLGLLVSLPLAGSDPFDFDGGWLVLAGVALGVFAATGSWLVQQSTRRATDNAPVQRENGVKLLDYLPTWSAIAVVVVAVVAVSVAAMLVWLPSTGYVENDGERLYLMKAGAFFAVIVGLLVTLLVAKLSFARPQRAVSPEALAWDDAIISQALFPVAYLGSFFGGLLLVQIGSGVSSAVTHDVFRGWFVLLALVPLPIYALALVSMLAKPARHFLRKLWPAVVIP